jgi:hypothetical protein
MCPGILSTSPGLLSHACILPHPIRKGATIRTSAPDYYLESKVGALERVPPETHLQMIQAVITRLASQSTTVKGWCVTVTAALLGFGATAATPVVALIALYVVVAFAVLDSYYLALERGYRQLYQAVIDGTAEPWALSTGKPTPSAVAAALHTPAIVALYGSSLLTVAAIGIYLAVT